MATKKASKKSTGSKAARKAAKKGGGGSSGEVQHSPIIITDGSASIQFDKDEYPQTSATTHKSKNLQLARVSANKKHNNGGSIVCHDLDPDESVLIKFTCEVGGSTTGKEFIIRGGNMADGSGSPSIDFDHGVYNQNFSTIPVGSSNPGKRVGNAKGNILKLEIFRITSGNPELVHDCDVIAKKNFRIFVRDPHVH